MKNELYFLPFPPKIAMYSLEMDLELDGPLTCQGND